MPIINLKGDAVIYTPPERKLEANSQYGKGWHGTTVTAKGVVHDTDAVSAYPEPPESSISVYHDSETDVELLLARDGQTLTIRVGTDRLELSGKEWRGLYSGVLNTGPGRPTP
jgi:hypothetical protein